jgi:protoporphyrinogen/coproporphyrinogen III oxidase
MSKSKKPSGSESTLTRRTVLQGLAATSLVTRIPRASARRALHGKTALVVGGGVAGLSAAYELDKAGFDVTIFEKWSWTGGRMCDAWMGPLYGYTHAYGICPWFAELVNLGAELGISPGLEPPPGYPFTFPASNEHGTYELAAAWMPDLINRIPGLSEATRQQLPAIQKDMVEIKQAVDPCLLANGGAAYDNETVEEYFNRKLDPAAADEILEYWIEPALSYWGWPKEITSKIALFPWLAQASPVYYPPKWGIGVLTTKLRSILSRKIRLQHTVRFISPPDSSGRHTVTYLDPNFEQKTVTPDVVVVSTEGKFVYALVQGLTPSEEAFFKPITTTVEAIVNYVLKPEAAPTKRMGGGGFSHDPDPWRRRCGWSVSPAEQATYFRPVNPNEPINHRGAGSWYKVPVEPVEYTRPPLATVSLSREYTPVWQESNQAIQDFCAPLLKHFWPQFDMRNVVDIVNYTCEDLTQMPVGYVRQMAAIVREQEKARRGLYYAGEYVSGCWTGAACASGRSTARTIIKQWTS